MREKNKETWAYIDPYYGAQIRVKTDFYYHHGIYLDDMHVIHFGNRRQLMQNAATNIVHVTTLAEFVDLDFLEVRVYNKSDRKKLRSPSEIVETAKACLGEGNYDFLHNNCEHFSNFCAFGTRYSLQSELLRKAVLSAKK